MVPQLALIGWFLIATALFAILNPLRAFLLTYIVGLLFLPVEMTTDTGSLGAIVLSQSLRIERLTACNIAAFMGTLLFATHVIRRFRFQWLDIPFAAVMVGVYLTSVVNDQGAKDGFSSAVTCFRDFLPIVVLSRLYIRSFADIVELFRGIIGGALVYSLICVVEWRLSPMIHLKVYGYFQHSFEQFIRYNHFRPVGFMHHAIELSMFMGISTVLAAWLWYKKMFPPLWGLFPAWVVVPALLVGLCTTMTFAGYGAFLLAVGMLGLFHLTRSRWVLWILPIVAAGWMLGRYNGALDASLLLKAANYFDSTRSESLEYRLESEQVHLASAANHFLLGKGAQNGMVRDAWGHVVKAVDAEWLIELVFFGFVGLGGWYLVWSACIYETFSRWRRLPRDAQDIAAIVCILIGLQFINFLFNAFPSMFLLMLDVGLISAIGQLCAMRGKRRRAVAMPRTAPMPEAWVQTTAGRGER